MERLVSELKAKSLFIDSLKCGIFFSWDLFTKADKYGITIDANALIDPKRNLSEVTKLIYLCMESYHATALALGMNPHDAPSISQVEAWMSLCPDEAAGAIRYVTTQLFDNSTSGNEKKKSVS